MLIETKLLGEVNVEESDIITFEQGLPGFLNLTKFGLISINEELPFLLLQSIEDPEVGFVLAYPFAFKSDYTFELSEEDKEELRIEAEQEVSTYTIVTLHETFANSTINLLAPIVMNVKKKIGKQIVLQDSKHYALRHPLGTMEGSAK